MSMIDPLQAGAAFQQFAADQDAGDLHAESAIALMIAFYRVVRAEGCNIDQDGDMLLFQWGIYDHSGSKAFTYDITRQFMVPLPPLSDPEMHEDPDVHLDPEMYQLSLTLYFVPTESMRACGSGDRWCPTPNELPAFESFIRGCPATAAIRSLQPTHVSLTFDPV
jgi:hypothetical protein